MIIHIFENIMRTLILSASHPRPLILIKLHLMGASILLVSFDQLLVSFDQLWVSFDQLLVFFDQLLQSRVKLLA